MVMDADGNIRNRVETLFVSDEHQLFFLTGQPTGNGRKARISVLPFHALDEETYAGMRNSATIWTPKEKCLITIKPGTNIVTFRDDATGVETVISRRELEPDFKGTKGISPAFERYAPPSTKTAQAITIRKPLTFRNAAP